MKVTLNTENGTTSFTTKKLKGKLDAIISNSDAKVRLVIESTLGYVLFDNYDVFGMQYFPLRVRPIDDLGHGWNYSAEMYCLNEPLNIIVIGGPNKEISLIFRLL